ncbi:MAG: 2Fe-2S iron-sulfur cluster binding domain-containing protein [Betaproteobacteria bacterium]|nr:2Fe-2S iron-sulfur cluster binding domain-containing protein [Betaproteobacteria bacterium]
MAELLTLTRAARLVGVARGVLQRRVREGTLASFEGMVRADDLVRAFPGTQLEDNAEMARVERIKERAFGRRVYERSLPDKEVLAARLGELARELAQARASAARSEALLHELGKRLEGNPLGTWLSHELEAGMASGEDEHEILAQDGVMRVMTPHVKVVPGGQEFFVEGADTVLEAALHAGLAMAYGCSIGTCGECKARVVAGSLKKVRHHDFRLTEAEKLQGCALLCCHTALTDLVIEANVARGAAEIPPQSITAHVRKMDPLSEDVILLEVLTPRTSRLRFLAGQSAIVELGGVKATWPIASCPCEERRIQFHVRRIAGNRFSDYVFHRLRIGEAVALEGPVGEFVLRDEEPRPLVFVAWGWEGFAPVKSVIEHALAQDSAESIDLVWIVASASEHYYSKLCRAWADAMDNFRFTPVVARELPDLGDLSGKDIYVAGDSAQVEATRARLADHAVPAERMVAWVSR